MNSGIDFRHFYFEQEPRLDETSDELNARYWSQSISGISGARGRSTSLKGVDESSCLVTAHAPSRRRSGSLCPACFMLPRLA